MVNSKLNKAIGRLCSLLREGTDGELLACFIEHQDEAAFEVLVHRHGSMVFGVCQRVLPNQQDAEDAFQATFLVLVRKATSIVPREMVPNWLYGVAYQTARKARAMLTKRRSREMQVPELPEPKPKPERAWQEVQPMLDQELSRLPDKYRVPIVLCDLEGNTQKEAAQRLGWPEGTVSGRLARARAMLAKRLTRRGVVLSASSLAAVLSHNAATACMPTSLAVPTVKAAGLYAAGQRAAGVISVQVATLTEEVINSMLLTKLKTVMAIAVALAFSVTGAGLVAQQIAAQQVAENSPSQFSAEGGKAQGNRSKNVGDEGRKDGNKDNKDSKNDGQKNGRDDGDMDDGDMDNKNDGQKNGRDDGDMDDGDMDNKNDGQKSPAKAAVSKAEAPEGVRQTIPDRSR
jgi:RNA polymerase sigma-70 factor (ECF subfamily)